MSDYDLSILIPARGEMFVTRTVQDILKNKCGKTEIIVGLDGKGKYADSVWPDEGIPVHPDVKVVHVSESRGQRGMTNILCKLSKAKWVAKVDAHCAFDEGFDVKLLEAAKGHDDWTIVPTMKNLHVFDWVCEKGHRRYQGPSGVCTTCGLPTERDVVWYAKPSPNSTAYTFDKDLHFQYFNEFKKRPEGQGNITPTMSLQGSFFMLTRDKYWELDICDEKYGSWGQQGVEVACKTWLSGGRVMCVQTTWYAHMFRTQGGDFSFPYDNPESKIQKARERSRDIWVNNKWPLAKYDLPWLINKFAPVPGWNVTKGIIYYTDNQLNVKLAKKVQKRLKKISVDSGIPIVSSSLKPMDNMGANIHIQAERGYLTMFKQILAALEKSMADVIFFCEHDVLYHPSHFDFIPSMEDKFYYNHNWWSIREDGFAVSWDANRVSQLCVYREYAIKFYRERINQIEKEGFNRSYEPGGRDKSRYESWKSEFPNIDIRHKGTLTGDKWSRDDFRDKSTCINWEESDIDHIPGWDDLVLIL